MKKSLVLFILLLITNMIIAQSVQRVTLGMNLQNKIDSSSNGTTFYLEPGVLVTTLDIKKKVTIIGTGYFLNSSTSQATLGVSAFSNIRFSLGSEGSLISGIKCGSINISANNITVQRCYTEGSIRLGYTGLNDDGVWSGTANNCMILQNYASRLEIVNQDKPTATSSNFVVKGNIFYGGGFHLEGNISGEISNNTFVPGSTSEHGYHSISQSTASWAGRINTCGILSIIFRNNIMPNIHQPSSCPINNYPTLDFNGNVFTQNFPNLSNNNKISVDISTLFLGYPNNPSNLQPDERAQLAPNSPAKSAGVGGTEAGAFGGDMPYLLSGIPNIPYIKSLTVPFQIQQGKTLNIQIKAKVNN